jgi:hypothetical protein
MEAIKVMPFVLGGLACYDELRRAVINTPGVIITLMSMWFMEGRPMKTWPVELQVFIKAERPFTNSLVLLSSDSGLNSEIIAAVDGKVDEVTRVAVEHLRDMLCQLTLNFDRIGMHISVLHHFQSTTPLLLSLEHHKAVSTVVKVLKTCNNQPSAFDLPLPASMPVCEIATYS